MTRQEELKYFLSLVKQGEFDFHLPAIRSAAAAREEAIAVANQSKRVRIVFGDIVQVCTTAEGFTPPYRQYNVVGRVKRISETTAWIVPLKDRTASNIWSRLTGYQQLKGFKAKVRYLKLVQNV